MLAFYYIYDRYVREYKVHLIDDSQTEEHSEPSSRYRLCCHEQASERLISNFEFHFENYISNKSMHNLFIIHGLTQSKNPKN